MDGSRMVATLAVQIELASSMVAGDATSAQDRSQIADG
jgi:hypothetical protein